MKLERIDYDIPTTFVLGAGFSAAQQFPLMSGLKERVIHFLEAERHSSYKSHLEETDWFSNGQFYEGLRIADPDKRLGLEELLIEIKKHLVDGQSPCHVTERVLKTGTARLWWCISSSIWQVEQTYRSFAKHLGSAKGRWHAVTFNWDLLLEQACIEAGVRWSYSLDEAIDKGDVPILKPHGSINWNSFRQQGLSPEYQGWRAISPGSTISYDADNPLRNPDMQEVNPLLRWCLYPGDPDLPESHSDIQNLWRDVTQSLRNSARVVFIGYSLPEYDVYAGDKFKRTCEDKGVEVNDPSGIVLDRFSDLLPRAILHERRFEATPYASWP
ncbi:MAG: hypothetical protein P8020_22100 [Acidobacteriota bacterium]